MICLILRRGARVAGAGFYYLKNAAVRLDLALQHYAISFLADQGFTPITTPDLALTSILKGIGFTPRGRKLKFTVWRILNSIS